jgi:hypothetical protein
MSVSDAVRFIEQELKYFREASHEQSEIIQQLHRGAAVPGRPTYIHPADLAEIVHGLSPYKLMDVFSFLYDEKNQPVDKDLIHIDHVTYKQSMFMPQISTKLR